MWWQPLAKLKRCAGGDAMGTQGRPNLVGPGKEGCGLGTINWLEGGGPR